MTVNLPEDIDYREWLEKNKDDVLRDAVAAIDPDRAQMTRNEALTFAGAMKNCGFTCDEFSAVMARSAMDKGTFGKQWQKFKGEGKHGTATEGTIFNLALRSGWKWPNPQTFGNSPCDGDRQMQTKAKPPDKENYISVDSDFKIRVIVDSVQYDSKPDKVWEIRKREPVPTPYPEPMSIEEFYNGTIIGKTFHPTVFNKRQTGTDEKGKPEYTYDPICQQVFVVDIDNEEIVRDENGQPVKDENGKQKKRRIANPLDYNGAVKICQENGIAPLFFYETFSSKLHRDDPEEPYIKFRIVFITDEPLTVQEVGTRGLDTAISYFIGLFGDAADKSTTDWARLIYGTDEWQSGHLFKKAIKKEKLIELMQSHESPGTTSSSADPVEKDKTLTVTNYDDVEIKETDYLYFPWFPRGKLTTIQGDSGTSKSTFTYTVGARVTTGEDIMGVPCEDPGNVMFLTNEDDPGDILTAFADAGGDISKLYRIKERDLLAQITLSEEGAKLLNDIIKKYDIKFLVLDPIQAFIAGDMNKASETRPQLVRLMNIAEENNNVIAFIQHLGKDGSKSALYRAIGSVDINASTRSVLQVVTDPNDDLYKIVFTVKNNTAALQDVRKAIRYQIRDHPDNYDHVLKKRRHFHGHAELIELIPEYNERLYKKAVRKVEEDEELNEFKLSLAYDKEPLVMTARKLIEENPGGLFIGTDDFIQKITIVCGRCPYEQSKNSINGINNRVAKMRELLIDRDGIQIDIQSNSIYPKAYNWQGVLEEPEHIRTKGFKLTPVKASQEGYQQTRI